MTAYAIRLTGPQLRVLHELLSVVLNDPYWYEGKAQDHSTVERAHSVILNAWREAARSESHPA